MGNILPTDGTSAVREAWKTPAIEDYGIVESTMDIDNVPGIDAFEVSNPVVYGS